MDNWWLDGTEKFVKHTKVSTWYPAMTLAKFWYILNEMFRKDIWHYEFLIQRDLFSLGIDWFPIIHPLNRNQILLLPLGFLLVHTTLVAVCPLTASQQQLIGFVVRIWLAVDTGWLLAADLVNSHQFLSIGFCWEYMTLTRGEGNVLITLFVNKSIRPLPVLLRYQGMMYRYSVPESMKQEVWQQVVDGWRNGGCSMVDMTCPQLVFMWLLSMGLLIGHHVGVIHTLYDIFNKG